MAKFFQLLLAVVVAYFVLQFLGAGPNPLPGPDPTPPGPVDPSDPEPDFSGYADKVYSHIVKVKSRTRKAECETLSADVQSIVGRIDSGTITTNQGVVDAMKESLLKLPRSWYGEIRQMLDKVFKPLTLDNTLNSTKRWKSLLTAIKPGIDRAGAESTGVAE